MATNSATQRDSQNRSRLHMMLDALDKAQDAEIDRERRNEPRRSYRRRIKARMLQPGGSESVTDVVTRNLSAGGASFVLPGYVHVGTVCTLDLITFEGAWDSCRGTVIHCRLLGGRVHEAGVRWETPIEVTRFVPDRLRGKIMLVDDAPDFRELTSFQLSRGGLTVHPVEGGEQALARIQNEDYDLVIIDIHMPGLSGIEVIRQMRDDCLLSPILAISADSSEECRVNCLMAGADEFLNKPFQTEMLAQAIRNHLGDTEPIISEYAGQEDMKEFLAKFVQRLPDRLGEMRKALKRGDETTLLGLIRDLRTMASRSGGCGYEELARAAAEVEPHLQGFVRWSEVARLLTRLGAVARRIT